MRTIFDRAPWRDPVNEEVAAATTASRNVERAKTRHDLVSGLGACNIGAVGKLANSPNERFPVDARLSRAKILSGPF
jgi:hypothetical protein